MINLTCTPDRDSSNSYPSEDSITFCISQNEITIKLLNPDRIIILTEEDTKQLLKLLKFELEN